MSDFVYQDPFPLGPDTTEYECLTTDHVSLSEFEGQPVLKVAPEALALLANEAMKAINFTLRPSHLAQVAAILDEPPGTRIAGITTVADRLAVQLTGGGADRIVLLDPRTGQVAGRVALAR